MCYVPTGPVHTQPGLITIEQCRGLHYGLEVKLVHNITEKVPTLMHEEWQSKIPYKPKLCTFSLYKQDLETKANTKTSSKFKLNAKSYVSFE